MSFRVVAVAIVLALIVGALAGRFLLSPSSQTVTSNPNPALPDDAAKAASRAMTFTQPKATPK